MKNKIITFHNNEVSLAIMNSSRTAHENIFEIRHSVSELARSVLGVNLHKYNDGDFIYSQLQEMSPNEVAYLMSIVLPKIFSSVSKAAMVAEKEINSYEKIAKARVHTLTLQ